MKGNGSTNLGDIKRAKEEKIDRKWPRWTSSFQRLLRVTPFPGMYKGTRKLDTDIISIQLALSCSFDSYSPSIKTSYSSMVMQCLVSRRQETL